MQADVENQGKPAKAKIDKTKAVPRAAAGQKWYDATLSEWPESDFRIFVGDMGNEVNDDILTKAFTKYASFQKAKIVRDKHSNKSKGALFSVMQLSKQLYSFLTHVAEQLLRCAVCASHKFRSLHCMSLDLCRQCGLVCGIFVHSHACVLCTPMKQLP